MRSTALGELPTSGAHICLIVETVLAIGQGLVAGAILIGAVLYLGLAKAMLSVRNPA